MTSATSVRDVGRIRMLLVEDNPLDAHLVQTMLATPAASVAIESVDTLRDALTRLAERSFDAVVLDLSLPDACGLDALRAVHTHAPEVPVVVLTGRADQRAALQAVRNGAQDYLTKERLEPDLLLRALRYAIERQQLLREIRQLSLKDELTGLYNRRGFFTLAEQQLKIALRNGHQLALFYADVDGLKEINDALGHAEGDRAIQEAANVLRDNFYSSDIRGRLGGDEFVVLALDIDERRGPSVILKRILKNIDGRNTVPNRGYTLSLSIGVVVYDPVRPASLEELLERADEAMYVQKRDRRPVRIPAWTTPNR